MTNNQTNQTDRPEQSNNEVMRERMREALRPKPMSERAARSLFGDTTPEQ